MRAESIRIMAVFMLYLTGSFSVNVDPARAFHFGGVGACDSCHSMHDARDGDPLDSSGSSSLLIASDPSSVCLNCHAGMGGGINNPSVFSPDGSGLTPGGDFYWLVKTFTWADGSSPGDSHGHNVNAVDFNLGADLRLVQSPGGSYPSAELGCTSCHDPHGLAGGGTQGGAKPISVSGSYGELPAVGTIRGNYRLLGDSTYDGGLAGAYDFMYDAPVARQNINARFAETDLSHVDYGTGMSEWCANCHEGMLRNEHSDLTGGFVHPSGIPMTGTTVDMYNSYINTGDLSGIRGTAYLQFVPFERGYSDPQQLDPMSTLGPDTTSRIMCLTCHRAHASAFSSIGRWDLEAVQLAQSHPASGDSGVSGNDIFYSYYGRNIALEFGLDQGPFCEKCHGLTQQTVLDPLLQQMPGQGILNQEPLQIFRERRRF